VIQYLIIQMRFAFDPDRKFKVKIEHEGRNYCWRKTKPGPWWLARKPDAGADSMRKLMNHRQQVYDILARYKNVSPLATEIADGFTDFRIAVLDMGQMFYYIPDSENMLVPSKFSVCFIPIEEVNREGDSLFSFLFWSPNVNSMFIVAYDFPEPLLAAAVFHECGHGLLHSVRKEPEDPDPFHAKEEVTMHSLGSLVMNEATKGELFKAIDRVLDREHPKDFKEAIAALTADDMRSFDQIVGAGNRLLDGQILCTEYYYIAGFRTIDRNKGSLDEKAECYRWLTWAGNIQQKIASSK